MIEISRLGQKWLKSDKHTSLEQLRNKYSRNFLIWNLF
jgi:hypothetical protein